MIDKVVDISTANNELRFRVLDVDLELRLFELPSAPEIFDANSQQLPDECVLRSRKAIYVVRYNNNDGGPGVLHFQVLEVGAREAVRYEVDIRTINGPKVIELAFQFRSDPSLPGP